MALVNFENVASAAEALQAAGQRASVRAVIAALGGGSPNSVLKMLAEWKAGRPVVRIADTELDHRITDAIKVQMQRVAEQAAAAAEERAGALDEDLQALAEAQAQSEQQIAGLTAERDEAQAQTVDFLEQLKEVQADAVRDQNKPPPPLQQCAKTWPVSAHDRSKPLLLWHEPRCGWRHCQHSKPRRSACVPRSMPVSKPGPRPTRRLPC